MSVIDRIPQNVRATIRRFRPVIIGVLIFLLIAIVALSYFNAQKADTNSPRMALSPLQTPEGTPTATVFPPPGWATPGAQAPQSAINFVSGSEWKVKELLGKSTIDGYNSLDIMFENITTGQTANGHCQSKHDPHPEVNDIYTLIDTGQKDEYGREIWLFSPHYIYIVKANGEKITLDEGIESKYQRFRLTQ